MRGREEVVLLAIYLVVVLGSLAGAVAVAIRGDIGETGVDGLFLLAVCLLFAAVFGLTAAQTIRREFLAGWLARRKAPGANMRATKAAPTPAGHQPAPPAGNVRCAGRVSPVAMTVIAVLSVVVPFLTWRQTWFGRRLSDAQIQRYLADQKHPRNIQHALSQISDRLVRGDLSAREWDPQVAALADNPAPPIRATAAWVMGQDNSSAGFHQRLLKLLADPDLMVRRNAALSLVRFRDGSGRPELLAILRAHTFRSVVSGRFAAGVQPHQQVGAGTVLARISPARGRPVEVRSAFAGEVAEVMVNKGEWVEPGQALVAVDSGTDQAWEALRGLFLIGQPEDLPVVENYASHAVGASESLRQQAELAAAAIRARPERNTIR